jgi:hypothetical protein
MTSTRIPDHVKRIFTETFTAKHIAEPLASFDADASGAIVREFMQARDFDVVGIRIDGQVAGYVEKAWLEDGACGQFRRGFENVTVLDDNTPLLQVLLTLNNAPFGFVTAFGTVSGIIAREDLQKPAVRMWLFGMVTLIELRFAELIELHFPDGAWKKYVSEARLQKAQSLLEERKRRNQMVDLFDCLQFSDKGQIIARNEEIRNRTILTSRTQAEAVVKSLEQLRNNLAHAQDLLATDWDTIVRLCEFVHSSTSEVAD